MNAVVDQEIVNMKNCLTCVTRNKQTFESNAEDQYIRQMDPTLFDERQIAKSLWEMLFQHNKRKTCLYRILTSEIGKICDFRLAKSDQGQVVLAP